MSDVSITNQGRSDLHVLDLWGGRDAADRIAAVLGHPLPEAGKAAGSVLRTGPNRWLVEGEAGGIGEALGDDGAITAIGGGIDQVLISGPAWRSLLMEGGLFDAESADFVPGSVATTLIDHVTIILRVASNDTCIAYVPASHAADLMHFWNLSAGAPLP